MQPKNGVRFSDEIFMVLTEENKVHITKNSDRMIYMKPDSIVKRKKKYKDKNVAIYRLEDIVSFKELEEMLEEKDIVDKSEKETEEKAW